MIGCSLLKCMTLTEEVLTPTKDFPFGSIRETDTFERIDELREKTTHRQPFPLILHKIIDRTMIFVIFNECKNVW